MTEFADVSMERIHTLNSKLIESAINVLRKCLKQKLPIHILWGSRTLEQQDLLYRFGRTLHGSIITHRRPGYSAHNFGLALDFCLSEGTRLLIQSCEQKDGSLDGDGLALSLVICRS